MRVDGEERGRAGGKGYYTASLRGAGRSKCIARAVKCFILINSEPDMLSHAAVNVVV